jgi:hypothetical protein
MEFHMKASTKGLKTVRCNKRALAWESSPEHTVNPWVVTNAKFKAPQEKVEDYQTFCFRLPVEALRVERIAIGPDVLWERSQGSTFTSAMLAGGGRWAFRRTWFARKVVGTDIILRDLPLARYGNARPEDITVVVSC